MQAARAQQHDALVMNLAGRQRMLRTVVCSGQPGHPLIRFDEVNPLTTIRYDVRIIALDELRWALIVSAYLDRQINLGKAAELLDVHELELRDRFLELGIPLRIGPVDAAEARAEVEAARSWFQEPAENSTP